GDPGGHPILEARDLAADRPRVGAPGPVALALAPQPQVLLAEVGDRLVHATVQAQPFAYLGAEDLLAAAPAREEDPAHGQEGAGPLFQNSPACPGRWGRLRRSASRPKVAFGDPGITDSHARAEPLLTAISSFASIGPIPAAMSSTGRRARAGGGAARSG